VTRGTRLLIVVAVIALAAGCGGASSDTSQISSTLTTYLSALADGNGRAACDQLTGAQARAVVETAASAGATSCVDAIDELSRNLGGDEKRTLRDAKVVNIHVNRDRATADALGATQITQLVKSGGHWLISGGTTTPSAASSRGQSDATPTTGSFDEVRKRLADAGLHPVSTPPTAGRAGALEVPVPHGSTLVVIFFGTTVDAHDYVYRDPALGRAVHEGHALVLAAGDHVYLLAPGSTVTNSQRGLFDRVVEVGEGEAR
jgi:hypothetical protein